MVERFGFRVTKYDRNLANKEKEDGCFTVRRLVGATP
jgi:hypothetical protein